MNDFYYIEDKYTLTPVNPSDCVDRNGNPMCIKNKHSLWSEFHLIKEKICNGGADWNLVKEMHPLTMIRIFGCGVNPEFVNDWLDWVSLPECFKIRITPERDKRLETKELDIKWSLPPINTSIKTMCRCVKIVKE